MVSQDGWRPCYGGHILGLPWYCFFHIFIFFTFIFPFLLGSSSLCYFVLLLNCLVVCKVSWFSFFSFIVHFIAYLAHAFRCLFLLWLFRLFSIVVFCLHVVPPYNTLFFLPTISIWLGCSLKKTNDQCKKSKRKRQYAKKEKTIKEPIRKARRRQGEFRLFQNRVATRFIWSNCLCSLLVMWRRVPPPLFGRGSFHARAAMKTRVSILQIIDSTFTSSSS